MNSNSTKVSPRGWALLVLAGGGALAFPFLKPSESTSVADVSRKADSAAAAERPLVASAESETTMAGLLFSDDASSVEHQTDQRTKQVLQPAVANVLTAGPNTIPAGETISASNLDSAATESPPAELPAWAKPPSLLDSLLTKKPSGVHSSSAGSAVRPGQFAPWQNLADHEDLTSKRDCAGDRATPFGDQPQIVSAIKPTLAEQTLWPEDDPRTAVAINSQPKIVGRDAMIRSVQPATDNVIPPRVKSTRSVSHAAGELEGPMHEPSDARRPIEFGSNSEGQRRGQAALSSQVLPAAELFIHQPLRNQ